MKNNISIAISAIFLFLLFFRNSEAQEIKSVPDTVKIGTYIVSLHDINFHDKEYTLRFWMWMLYSNPKFDFANRVEVPNAKSLEKPETLVDSSNNLIWVLLKMKCTMKQSWKVQDFPFDKQDLVVHVENSEFDTRSLVFVADTAGKHFDPQLTVDGWNLASIKINTSTNEYETAFGDSSLKEPISEYATFNIFMRLERNTWGLFFKLFLCMYIAFLIAYMSFFIHSDHIEASFGLQVGGLFASVGNKYIIDSILPESSSFTLVDSLHAVTYMYIFFIIVFSVISLEYYKKGDKRKSKKIDDLGKIITLLSYMIINTMLVCIAIYR